MIRGEVLRGLSPAGEEGGSAGEPLQAAAVKRAADRYDREALQLITPDLGPFAV